MSVEALSYSSSPDTQEGDPPAPAAAAACGVEPISFDGMLGWLHRPASAADVGVLICAPVGRDARCAHLLLRWIGDALAEAGYPALRFDYLGCGDSLDVTPNVDALSVWTANIHQAANALRATTGVRRLVFCGLRLGASLAAAATQAREDVAGLVMMAPVVRGRAWLRELKLAAELGTPSHRPGPRLTGPPPPELALESNGLGLSAATVESLARLDLRRLDRTPAEVMLVSPSGAAQLTPEIAGLGARVTELAFPGLDLLFDDTHSNVVPEALVQATVDWIEKAVPQTPAASAGERLALLPPELRPPGAIERPVCFGEGLRGVLCLPTGRAAAGRSAVFCNTGGDPRAGAGGFSTTAARRLAQQGVASLRFDFAGLGDSSAPGVRARTHIYATPRTADLDAALALLATHGLHSPVLVGLCAGAHHAYWTAARDRRVSGVFLVSLIKFVWRPGDSLSVAPRDQARAARSYVQGLGDPEIWRRLTRGEVRLWTIGSSLLRRLVLRLGKSARRRERRAVRQAAVTLSSRGGRAHMLLGLEDASLEELETYFGRDGRGWAARPDFSVSIVDGLDHGLLRAASRAVAIDQLCAFMDG